MANESAPVAARPDGRARAVIENIAPAVNDGRFAIKRAIGERVIVEADVFTDGHSWSPAAAFQARTATMRCVAGCCTATRAQLNGPRPK